MKKLHAAFLAAVFAAQALTAGASGAVIANGIPWYDNNGDIVNAHGAGIIADGGKYYMFGEWKSDTSNAFSGFACYSSDNLSDWTFEGVALGVQPDGLLGSDRVGERVKVMKSPATGEYVMFMHADNLQYKDPYTTYATSETITGPYTFRGPVMFEGKPLRHWDMGTFQDSDGTGYILAHHGPIYRLSPDYHSVEAMVSKVEGSGESPAVFHKGGLYFHLSSNLTSWERNDNFYFTAPSIEGPWTRRGLFCPEGSLTWNSQSSFVLPLIIEGDTVPMYMGDRWSFPHQASSATCVWLPMKVDGTRLSIPDYMQFWDASTGKEIDRLAGTRRNLQADSCHFRSNRKGEQFVYPFIGSKVAVKGTSDAHGGYGRISIVDKFNDTVWSSLVDFYSLRPASDIKIITPDMPVAEYRLIVSVEGEHPAWSDKKGNRFGSDDDFVTVDDVCIYDIDLPEITFPDRDFIIIDYGAVAGDGVDAVNANTAAVAAAIAACSEAGGGRVVVPAGDWHTGPVHFRSNVNLYLAEGARLIFADEPQRYLPAVPTSWEGMECLNYSPLVYAYECENIAITGQGTLAPEMDLWRTWFKRPQPHMDALKKLYAMMSENVPVEERDMARGENHLRPHMVHFNRCRNILLDGFKIRESPFWTIHLYLCENGKARNLDVYAHGHNNDGIDLEMTRNFLVENCNFDQGDDGVVIKSGRNQDGWRVGQPTENIVIRDCNIANAHTLLGIGSEISGGIRNVYMHHCTVPRSVFRLLFVKTNHRRGAFVKDIFMDNVTCRHADTVFEIDTDVLYQWRDIVPTYETRLTEIDGVYLRDVRCESAGMMYRFIGETSLPIRNVGVDSLSVGQLESEASIVENVVDLSVTRTSFDALVSEKMKNNKNLFLNV